MTSCTQLDNCNNNLNYGRCEETGDGSFTCRCESNRVGDKCQYEKCTPGQYFSAKDSKCVNCSKKGGFNKQTGTCNFTCDEGEYLIDGDCFPCKEFICGASRTPKSGLHFSYVLPTNGQCATGLSRTQDFPTCRTNKPKYCGKGKGGFGPFGGGDHCDDNIANVNCTFSPPKCPAGYTAAGGFDNTDGLKWGDSTYKIDSGDTFMGSNVWKPTPSTDQNVGPTNPCYVGTDMRRCVLGTPVTNLDEGGKDNSTKKFNRFSDDW
jgi:hypothetical protein